jgi:polyphosphate glucokinase
VAETLSAAAGRPVTVLNDADAAGLAEMRVGAGRGVSGTVVMLTFGTGIGTALFVDGKLVPNTEFGHVEVGGQDAERTAAESVRERENLTWAKWAHRVQRYLRHIEMLLNPDLFIVGGGASKQSERWLPEVRIRTPIRVAELRNNAGIVGAALATVN